MVFDLKYIYKVYLQGKEAVPVLKDISLEVSEGEYVAIMGPSGSGKSTLMNIIGCLDKQTYGKYFLGEYEVTKYSNNDIAVIRNEEIGFVLQNFGLLADKTVYENISYPLIFNPAVKNNIMKKLITITADAMLIGDLLKKPVKELSGGQKQRVALARALVNRPNIIIADEPTAALDKATADEIMEVMKSLNSIGKTIVIVTHDRTVAEKCRRIVELSDGKIISDRTIA